MGLTIVIVSPMKTNSLIVIALFMSVLLLGGCSKSSEMEHYAKLVEYWQGREIKLPDVMTDVLTGDTIDFSDADFTILTYVDSAGCTSCKLRLPIWNEFANSLDSISDANVQFLVVVNSNADIEIAYLLKRDSYHFPVYIDHLDKVNTANLFPTDHRAQTFLLDRYNKVIAIGNPTLNNTIRDLYCSVISGKKSLSITKRAIVDIDNQSLNLGRLDASTVKTEHFRIKNDSNDTVFIRDILTSCHCTEISLSSMVLFPKSSVECMVKYLGDTVKGEFDNTIYIYYKEFNYPSIIRISGTIK